MLGSIMIPLFPLSSVLFSGGYLPLQIFEPRYLRMIRDCWGSDSGFGVVLIKEGSEVRDADSGMPEIHQVGTLAEILSVKELPENRLAVMALGGAKFKVNATWEEHDHLMMGEVTFLPDEPTARIREADDDLVALLKYFVDEHEMAAVIRKKTDYTDERDVSVRLADLLPMDSEGKQKLLQMDSPRIRLTAIRVWSDL